MRPGEREEGSSVASLGVYKWKVPPQTYQGPLRFESRAVGKNIQCVRRRAFRRPLEEDLIFGVLTPRSVSFRRLFDRRGVSRMLGRAARRPLQAAGVLCRKWRAGQAWDRTGTARALSVGFGGLQYDTLVEMQER